ncbi:uncharacterized protein [Linepithema humile]|uniref:uncharacterized protein isoform X3 n=1 Tax=Linepithema humile TaxID=83485 RepID=UPI00351DEE18
MRIEIRNRYHNYLEKKFLKVPRTSQYRRNIECESSDESSDNSVEDAQWRMVDVSQISINDTNELYGLSDSENENFRDSWYYDAHEELFQCSDEDDSDNEDIHEEVNSEDINSENIGFSRLTEMMQNEDNNETINAQVVMEYYTKNLLTHCQYMINLILLQLQ